MAKPDKIKFFNEPKQTELAKQKHGINTIHTNICVTYHMTVATPQSNSSALLFYTLFYRTQHIMPFHKDNVKQNRLELREEVAKMAHVQML